MQNYFSPKNAKGETTIMLEEGIKFPTNTREVKFYGSTFSNIADHYIIASQILMPNNADY